MNSRFKGFTLVELLCAIVILGVLITASIVAVSKVINTAKEDEKAVQEQLLTKSCESYIQHFTDETPKAIGEVKRISLKKLYDSNYLKDIIKNSKGESCMINSYVRVYKLSDKEYVYIPYIYCGDDKVPEIEDVYKPTINMYFATNDNSKDNKIFNDLDNAYIYMDITGGTTKGGNPIAIDTYSFTISIKDSYGKELEVYSSEDIYANRKNNLNVKEKISDYVKIKDFNYISINVIVKNVMGGVGEVTTTTQYINNK